MTFPAHQGLIIAAKLRWPSVIDGTALCIGAAAPDIAYALGPFLSSRSHTAVGAVIWSLPFTLAATSLIRWRAASGVFAALPDAGWLGLRSYRVLGTRRPPLRSTLLGAVIGVASHVVVDAFTHANRFGSNWLGLNDVIATMPLRGEMTGARLLQYVGHIGGSGSFLLVLVTIARNRHLREWYGADAVERVQDIIVPLPHRLVFWAAVMLPVATATLIASQSSQSVIFLPLTTLVFAVLVAGAALGTVLDRSASGHSPGNDFTGG